MEWKLQMKTKEIPSFKRNSEKLLNNRAASETNPAQEKIKRRHAAELLLWILVWQRKQAVCGVMFWSLWTFTGAFYVVQLHCNFTDQLKGKCNIFSSAKLYSSLWDSVIEQWGLLTFNHVNGGLAETIMSNGGSLCNKVQSNHLPTVTTPLHSGSDTGDSCIKAYNSTVKQCSIIVGNGDGQDMEVKPSFSSQQASGFDYGTVSVCSSHLNWYFVWQAVSLVWWAI